MSLTASPYRCGKCFELLNFGVRADCLHPECPKLWAKPATPTASTKEITLEIPEVTPMLNVYDRWHWTKKRQHTREMALLLMEARGSQRWPTVKRCVLILERHSWEDRRRDWDGLFGGMKGLIDALTATHKSGIGLIEDDSTTCIIAMPTVMDVRCEKGKNKTRIRIIPMEDV